MDRILLDRTTQSACPIKLEHIVADDIGPEGSFTGAFRDYAADRAAYVIVRMLNARDGVDKNGFDGFTKNEYREFCESIGLAEWASKPVQRQGLEQLVAQGVIVKKGKIYELTIKFVAQCYAASPNLAVGQPAARAA